MLTGNLASPPERRTPFWIAPFKRMPTVVWTPDGIANGTLAWRLAQTAHAPLVFEAIPTDIRDPAVVSQRVDLTGKTVRDALDVLTGLDARYRWEEQDGVIVIRPASLWQDANDPLNQPVIGIAWDDIRVEEVLTRVMTIIDGAAEALPAAIATPPISIRLDTGTILDVLVAAARADGGVMWSLPDGSSQPGHAGFSLGFKTFDGQGAGLTAPMHAQGW